MLLEYGSVAAAGAIIGLRRFTRPAHARTLNRPALGIVRIRNQCAVLTSGCISKPSPDIQLKRSFNSPRRDFHDKFEPSYRDPGLLSFGVLVLAATSWAQTRPPIVEKLAKTYGLDSFGQIEAIRYTWNVEIPGLSMFLDTWDWEPKTGKVTYEGKDKDGKPVKVTYLRSQLSSQPDNVKNEIDPAFVNDNYWLIFPVPCLLGHQRHRDR